jgi:heme-degrading monooxygenase HmoA
MMIIGFRARLKPQADPDEYMMLAIRIYELASEHLGFISLEHFTAPDGTGVSIEHFETVIAWRNHPEHLEVQRRGREEFYSWYSMHTCGVVRSHEFTAALVEESSRS